jgi:GTP-binding protein
MASGRGAENILINIPIGTTIYDKNTNEVLCDILQPNQQFICCHGGKGGHGNAYFKNSHNRIPSLYENGDIGESAEITLKLKYVADVGFVGLPNAGKSTLISAISNAHPKTAPYQFTTLTPVLGTVIHKNNKLVFADIPGLIDGAAEGKGLGHEFLKHCERCHVLIHLISLNPEDTDDVLRDYQTISKELSCYDEVLSQKDKIIVGNKIDVPGSEKNLKVLQNKISKNIYAISGLKKENLTKFLDDVFTAYNDIVSKIPPPEVVVDPNADLKIKKYTNKSCTVTKLEEGRYAVESKYLTY